MNKSVKDYSVLSFDCYGTLIDWETGIWSAFQPLIEKCNPSVKPLSRNIVLEAFARHETRLQHERPKLLYPELLANVHRLVADELRVKTTEEMDQAFGGSVPRWPAFPDSAASLRELSQHYKLVILSNIDNRSFAASSKKLECSFDAVYTAEMIGSYKPDERNFEFLLNRLQDDFGIQQNEILHTAQSLYHDHVPARKIGLANAWIDRQNQAGGTKDGPWSGAKNRPEYDFLFPSMSQMVETLRTELGLSS